jgi:tRNA A37 threonylcarbamoyladenosine biosynthesis protein TsaE
MAQVEPVPHLRRALQVQRIPVMVAAREQVQAELAQVRRGQGLSKWLRGDYGAGKTFTARHIAAMARGLGFATAEVQVSANDTPLHHFEAVYRRMVERLETATAPACALPAVVDGWL